MRELLEKAGLVIFLMLMPWCAIFSFAKRTTLVERILVNTWDLTQMRLWCMGCVHESVMCVGVQSGKTCCFTKHILRRGHFHHKGNQIGKI